MKVSELGEFGLIDLLAEKIATAPPPHDRLIIGIGDDTAAWKTGSTAQLATVDSLVQGVHFTTETATWREIGWKSLAINLSDIAAMGGAPRYALVALSLPPDTEVADISDLYDGMIELAGESGTTIAGGNVSRSLVIAITITVIGESTGEILRRCTSRPGDVIAVTGCTGSAAAGLEMLEKKLEFPLEATRYFRDAFLHPAPRLKEGQALVEHGIRTAIDTSDGLLGDLRHICEASKVSATISVEKLPVHETVRKYFGDRAVELALSGGEDYELLFTGSTEAVERVKTALDCPVTVIGEITGGEPGRIDVLDIAGELLDTSKTGWTHF